MAAIWSIGDHGVAHDPSDGMRTATDCDVVFGNSWIHDGATWYPGVSRAERGAATIVVDAGTGKADAPGLLVPGARRFSACATPGELPPDP